MKNDNRFSGSCMTCTHLVRFKRPGDLAWHYRCEKYPNATDFDNLRTIKLERNNRGCGYERAVPKKNITASRRLQNTDPIFRKYSSDWKPIIELEDMKKKKGA